jgi:hypothetical protein
LPGPLLVTKKVISGDCGGCCCAWLAVEPRTQQQLTQQTQRPSFWTSSPPD